MAKIKMTPQNIVFYGRIGGVAAISCILLIGGIVVNNSEAFGVGLFFALVALVAYWMGR